MTFPVWRVWVPLRGKDRELCGGTPELCRTYLPCLIQARRWHCEEKAVSSMDWQGLGNLITAC